MRSHRVCPERLEDGGGPLDRGQPQHPVSRGHRDARTQPWHDGWHYETWKARDQVQTRTFDHEAALWQPSKLTYLIMSNTRFSLILNMTPKASLLGPLKCACSLCFDLLYCTRTTTY